MASNPYFEALENWAEGVPGFFILLIKVNGVNPEDNGEEFAHSLSFLITV